MTPLYDIERRGPYQVASCLVCNQQTFKAMSLVKAEELIGVHVKACQKRRGAVAKREAAGDEDTAWLEYYHLDIVKEGRKKGYTWFIATAKCLAEGCGHEDSGMESQVRSRIQIHVLHEHLGKRQLRINYERPDWDGPPPY